MLDALRLIVQDVAAARDLHEAMQIIVCRVKDAINADVCSVYFTDTARNEHVLMATNGLREDAVGRVRLKMGKGLVGLVANRAEPVNIIDAPAHPSFCFIPETGETPFHGFLGVPILRRRKTVGVLVVQQLARRRYTGDEESFLVTLAAQLAGILTQAEVRQSLERLDEGAPLGTVFLEGVSSVRGLSIGNGVVVYPAASLTMVPDRTLPEAAIDGECRGFTEAVHEELAELQRLGERMGEMLSAGDRALFDAYAMLLSGDSLVNGTLDRIRRGQWAPGALRATVDACANVFDAMDDPYLQGRAADIRDIGQRLLKRLQMRQVGKKHYPEDTILIGEDVAVSDLLDVPPERLRGLLSARGTSASHVALLARGLGVPAVFGVGQVPLAELDGRDVVVDGYMARVCVQPGPALREEYLRLIREESDLSRGLMELRDLPAITPDGHRVGLYANSGLFADIAAARDSGAEGVGLYRSEMHFFLRDRFPAEEEQTATYTRVLATMSPRPVTLRTLDIGGDKPLPYFPIREDNPFLGWRGIRISLDQPDIFKTQIRAMLRAGADYPNLSILLPMISRVTELVDALELIRQSHAELIEDGVAVDFPRLGLMLEVPSVLFQLDALVSRVDFVSIGTNDLTQYLLAVDRNNERVAKLYDGLNPGVLRALLHAVDRCHAHGCPVSVCGELAGDPAAVVLLMAMGVDALSMSLGNLLKIKWVIRSIHLSTAREQLADALRLESGTLIRQRLNLVLERHGLGGLVRGGR